MATTRSAPFASGLEPAFAETERLATIGRLASSVAHEFNNLLTSVLGYTDLVLAATPEEDRRRRDLLQIRTAAGNATELSRQMLSVSRRPRTAAAVLDLNQVLHEMRGLLKHALGEHNRLVLEPAATPALVRAERGPIEQMLLNLTVNARDAMPGGGRLRIDTAYDVPPDARACGLLPGAHVRLRLTDTGIGMTPEVRARAFEEHYTTKAPGAGAGLGLPIVEGIVLQCGGHVAITSELGRGTTVTIYLPPSREGIPPEPPAKTTMTSTPDTSTILLVEDNDQLRDLAEQSLVQRGYAVIPAAGAHEALRLADDRTSPIDLLLTDVVMPEMNGVDLGRHLSRRCPDLRVIYMSGYSDDSLRRLGIVDGPLPFLQKPFSTADLALRVREALTS